MKSLGLALLVASAIIWVPGARAQECSPEQPCVEVAAVSALDIAAYPAPNVVQLQPDNSVIFDRNYQRLNAAVDVYDAPDGNVIHRIEAGFNYVTAGSDQNGWTQINPNEWVRSEFLGAALVSRFSGVFLPTDEALPYPMAWMMVDAIPSRTPGVDPVDGDLPLMRYTRINLYTYQEIDGWRWYQVGPDQWIHQTQVAKIIPDERPAEVDTDRWISVDLYEQVLIAYEGDRPVFSTLVSSGLADWATNEGLFNIYVRYPRTPMSGAEGEADFYSLEEVPWTMYYDGDIGLHGTYWHDGFGYRHSHGCVNLSILDAKWLYEWASTELDFTVSNDTGAAVYVYSSGAY